MRRLSMRLVSIAGAILIAALVAPLSAQEWHLSAQAGRIRSVLDPSSASSQSFALGLRYDDPSAGLRISAGIPGSSNEALWGGVGGWKRAAAAIGVFRAGIDVSANAFLTMDRAGQPDNPLPGPPLTPPGLPAADRSGHAVAGQALPLLGYETSRFQVHARAGVSRYASEFNGQQGNRRVRLADVQLTIMPAMSFALVPVVRHFTAAGEAAATYAGVSAIAASMSGTVWGAIGHWSNDAAIGTPWSAGARLRLHPLVALEAGARHDAFDPLYLQPAQTSWSVGISVRLGGRPPSFAAPVPAAYVDGRATIRLPVTASRTRPSIAGDFNAWKPVPMRRDGEHWTYVAAIAPGVYHYAFVTAGGEWFVPETVAGRKSDGMGGHVAVLVVR